MNPFCAYVAGLMAGSQSWSQGCTHKWSLGLASPVPFPGTVIWTGTRHQTLAWRNKSHARIIFRRQPRNIFRHPCDPPSPPSFAHCARALHDHKRRQPMVEYRGKISESKVEILVYKSGTERKSDQNWDAKIDQHIL